MRSKAIFHRKESCFDPSECEIEKVIHLSDSDFVRFQQMLLDNYDFLQENAALMRVENGVTHCLLVVGETFEDGILVNSEGSSYARYAAYFPNAKSFLLTQGQPQQVEQAEAPAEAASPSVVGGISAALLAYGDKMNKVLDLAICQALECHDQSTYILSLRELQDTSIHDPFDEELFIAMLRERPEIVDMDVGDNGEVMVTLSLESIVEHDLSKMRILTQQDVEIMYAKHILFNYGKGGEKADFSNCRLTDLDLRHMQLNGADFTGALLENVKMNDSGLCFCVFRDTKLVGCNLNDAVAEESDFCGATFTECKMRNGIFTHSNFAHTSFQDTDLWMSSFASCCIDNSSNKRTVPRYDPCRGYHKTQWCEAASRGYHLWGQPLPGLIRSWNQSRIGWCSLRSFYGTNTNYKGDEKCRYTSRTIRYLCSPQISLLGKCPRCILQWSAKR